MYMFSKKMLILSTIQIKFENMEKCRNKKRDKNHKNEGINSKILLLSTRNSVLVFVTSFSVAMVTFFWLSFRWILLPQTRITLLIPMNMASIDSLVNCICVIMLFPFGDKLYNVCCKCCNRCFGSICKKIAEKKQRRTVLNVVELKGAKKGNNMKNDTKTEKDITHSSATTDLSANTEKTITSLNQNNDDIHDEEFDSQRTTTSDLERGDFKTLTFDAT